MIMTAQALMLAVDGELGAARAALEVLATAPELKLDDLATFHRRASELIRQLSGNNIVLTGQSGQKLVDTFVPFGEPLPPQRDQMSLRLKFSRSVFSTGKPVTSDLFLGAATKAPLVAIEVPVFRDGNVKYELSMSLNSEYLGQILDRQKLPPGWVAAIFDTNGITVARTRNHAKFVGEPGPLALIEMTKQTPNGFLETYGAFSRSETSNWTVAIGIPTAEMNRNLVTFIRLSAAGGIFILMIGVAIAGYKSSRITSAVQALVAPAMAFGRGEAPTIPRSNIREISEVAGGLEEAFEVAEGTARLKDEFIATVSHELRTPLTSITASLDLLNDIPDANRSEATNELIGIAQANSQRLTRLVNDILDIEKLEGGKVGFHMQRVEIGPLLEQAIEANRPMAESCGVTLRLETTARHDVCADPDRLAQVAANLLANAFKLSPPGAEVVVTAEDRDDKARISIRDHGPSIPEELRSRIFGKFAQAEISDERQKIDTGLGLSIVQQIVQRLGGEVGFADAPGGGTVFFVELPGLQQIDRGVAKEAEAA